jgi:hypothetical protein
MNSPASRPPGTFPRLEGAERPAAVNAPGPSWREYFYFSFAKAWALLAFAILDAWVVASWLQPLNAPGLALSLAGALYLEFLLYRYLWYEPGPEERLSRGQFRPRWNRPTRLGRWTPEAWRSQGQGTADEERPDTTQDASDFL